MSKEDSSRVKYSGRVALYPYSVGAFKVINRYLLGASSSNVAARYVRASVYWTSFLGLSVIEVDLNSPANVQIRAHPISFFLDTIR